MEECGCKGRNENGERGEEKKVGRKEIGKKRDIMVEDEEEKGKQEMIEKDKMEATRDKGKCLKGGKEEEGRDKMKAKEKSWKTEGRGKK